jgi:hypothetical protein
MIYSNKRREQEETTDTRIIIIIRNSNNNNNNNNKKRERRRRPIYYTASAMLDVCMCASPLTNGPYLSIHSFCCYIGYHESKTKTN